MVAASDSKAWAKDELARVQDALEIVKEAKHKAEVEAEAEAACLEVERTSFLLEIRAAKDELSSL